MAFLASIVTAAAADLDQDLSIGYERELDRRETWDGNWNEIGGKRGWFRFFIHGGRDFTVAGNVFVFFTVAGGGNV
jgi:hypothetical protein